MANNISRIVDRGGPLGATLEASPEGITKTQNDMAADVVVQADSHEEAAKLFEAIRISRYFQVTPSRS